METEEGSCETGLKKTLFLPSTVSRAKWGVRLHPDLADASSPPLCSHSLEQAEPPLPCSINEVELVGQRQSKLALPSTTFLPGSADLSRKQWSFLTIRQQQSSSQPFTLPSLVSDTQQGTELTPPFRGNKLVRVGFYFTRTVSAGPQGKLNLHVSHLQ